MFHVKQSPAPSAVQHDDHVWLFAGGKPWLIQAVRLPLIYLQGEHESTVLDVSNVDWNSYIKHAVELLGTITL